MSRTLLPDLVVDARGAHAGVGITIERGRIATVAPATDGDPLPGRALLPGFRSDHSHAFQRALRGRVERRDAGHPHDDFWTWRETMYALAESLDPEAMAEAAACCYGEMLTAGYTAVTEFHYIHHQPSGAPYADLHAMARAVIAGAERTGIRLTLLVTAYGRGGIPRFRDPDVQTFLDRVESLRVDAPPAVQVGVAAHSVRAVPVEWLRAIAIFARERALPLHVHAAEQPREMEECRAEYGLSPIALLAHADALSERTTVVHATHASEEDLDLLAAAGSRICVCPTTEGNLGDGFLPAEGVMGRGIPLSIGSDLNVRLDPFEELRELETNARRLAGRRTVLVPEGMDSPVPYLLGAGWGRCGLVPGAEADFLEIDLHHPTLVGIDPVDLPAALVFGAGREVVVATWVAGRRVWTRGE